jgi:hypothetical protein
MILNDDGGKRRYVPVRRRPPDPNVPLPDNNTQQAIRDVAEKYPRFRPQEIRAVLQHAGYEASVDQIAKVLA